MRKRPYIHIKHDSNPKIKEEIDSTNKAEVNNFKNKKIKIKNLS